MRIVNAVLVTVLLLSASSSFAGDNRFIWKPQAETRPGLAVLFPSFYSIKDVSDIYVKDAGGTTRPFEKFQKKETNGNLIHAFFEEPGSAFQAPITAVLVFNDGKTKEWSVPSGADRHETYDKGTTGSAGSNSPSAGTGTLDDVLASHSGHTSGHGNAEVDLNINNLGTFVYTFHRDGEATISAKLLTYGHSKLSVIRNSGGSDEELLYWERKDEFSSSPLHIRGEALPDSVYSPSPGDWAPHEVTRSFDCHKGDILILTLEGNFGPTTPHLRLTANGAGKATRH